MADMTRGTLAAVLAANERASLKGLDLSGLDLGGIDFRKADLSGSCLDRCDLREAGMSFVTARKASFRNARLTGADLFGADISGSDFSGASLESARIDSVDATGATLDGSRGFAPSKARNVTLRNAWWNQGRPADEPRRPEESQKPHDLRDMPQPRSEARAAGRPPRLTGAAALM